MHGEEPGVGSAGKTILIVDDESGILEVFGFIFSDAGFKVISALNGQEALATLQKDAADLVIVDFMMPILDGAGRDQSDARRRSIARDPGDSDEHVIRTDNQKTVRGVRDVSAQTVQVRALDRGNIVSDRSARMIGGSVNCAVRGSPSKKVVSNLVSATSDVAISNTLLSSKLAINHS
jgi:CheY-like chemotaxis protein